MKKIVKQFWCLIIILRYKFFMTSKDVKYFAMYMDIATRISQMSYATRKKVGAICVKNGNIIAMGWNGTPSYFDNSCESNGVTIDSVVHAEVNLISKLARNTESSKGSTIFLTVSPCKTCSLLIIQSQIAMVVYKEHYRDTEGLSFLRKAGIPCIRFPAENI